MNSLLDKTICLFINIFILLIWMFFMLTSSSIPVIIEKTDFLITLVFIFISLVTYSIYIRKTNYPIINLILLIPTIILWFISAKEALRFNYHVYNTLLSILGCFSTCFIAMQILFVAFITKHN